MHDDNKGDLSAGQLATNMQDVLYCVSSLQIGMEQSCFSAMQQLQK